MTRNNILFLFSGGQDSIFFLILYFFQEDHNNCHLLSINHESQVNSTLLSTISLKTAILYQKKFFLSFFKVLIREDDLRAEKNLRLARYQISFRLKLFYSLPYILSGHTKTDRLETFFFNIIQGFLANSSLLNFRKKKLAKKFYHQSLNFLSLSSSNKKILKSKHRKKRNFNFSLKFSTNKKKTSSIYRPIRNFSRFSLFKLSKLIQTPIFVDKTNFSLAIARNRIRRHLLLYSSSILSYNSKKQFLLMPEISFKAFYFFDFSYQIIFYIIFENGESYYFVKRTG